jgi:hypothetical protein
LLRIDIVDLPSGGLPRYFRECGNPGWNNYKSFDIGVNAHLHLHLIYTYINCTSTSGSDSGTTSTSASGAADGKCGRQPDACPARNGNAERKRERS